MARRVRHHRRGHAGVRKAFSLGGKIIGGLVVAGPAIRSVSDGMKAGTPDQIPRYMLLHYLGYDTANPSAGVQIGELSTGVASIIGGIALMKAFSYVAKRF